MKTLNCTYDLYICVAENNYCLWNCIYFFFYQLEDKPSWNYKILCDDQVTKKGRCVMTKQFNRSFSKFLQKQTLHLLIEHLICMACPRAWVMAAACSLQQLHCLFPFSIPARRFQNSAVVWPDSFCNLCLWPMYSCVKSAWLVVFYAVCAGLFPLLSVILSVLA